MESIAVYVGLDYHQDSVQVCVLDSAGAVLRNGSYENDVLTIVSVVENHGTPVHAAIESCTGAADLADELALRTGRNSSFFVFPLSGGNTKGVGI